MATVSVKYNFTSFRAKVTPNTVMNDVLAQSLSHFKLIDNEDSKNDKDWILEHNKKPITLDLPWRFLNLSPGTNLELKKGEAASTTDELTSIRIKLQVSGNPTVIETIKSTADLRDVLDILASKHGWSINLPESKLQVFSKTIPYSELRGLNLTDVGVKDSVLLRLTSPGVSQQAQPSSEKSTADDGPADAKDSITEAQNPVVKKHDLHKVSAFVPPETPLVVQLHNEEQDEHDYDMTVEQARAYQKMLSKQTGNLGGPLLSRRLREERDAAQKPVVTECVVRVRFPDLNHIEVAFQPDEDMNTIYKVVSESILPEHSDFTLSQPHPYIELSRDSSRLVEDLAFGSKTLLLFKSQREGPYLKNTVLEHAKRLGEADDVRLDQLEHTKQTEDNGAKPKTKLKTAQASKIEKVPKWLKLSKK